MLTSNGFLGFFLRYLVGFRRDKSDELDAALDEQITSIFAEAYTRARWKDFCDDLLNGCYKNDKLAKVQASLCSVESARN